MKSIFLTKNKVAFVDDEDYKWLSEWVWCAKESGGNKFYAVRRKSIQGFHVYMHKEIMKANKNQNVDHINGNTLDNRKDNLRICTHKQNLRNQKLSSANTSGYKGVSWNKRDKIWHAYIKVDQKRIHLGLFKNKINAAVAYNAAAEAYFGEFARLNEVGG